MAEYIKSIRKLIGHRPFLLCGTGVIVYSKGKVLLQLRSDNNCWGYHGGAIELDEVVEEAAKRELFEETGLMANSLKLFGVFSGPEFHYVYPNGDEVSNVDITYVCEDFSGELISDNDEVNKLKWFDINDLPSNISPPERKQLLKFIESKK